MSSNDLILVEQLLEQKQQELAPELTGTDFFQLFVSEQALKDLELSYDEIEQGIVDGGGDGGIDAVYLFVNNSLMSEPANAADVKRGVSVELIFIQAKKSPGFSGVGVDHLINSTQDLLDLNNDLDSLRQVYRSDLLEKIDNFRKTYLALASKFPTLSILYYYAALATKVHPNVERKVDRLKSAIRSQFNPVNTDLTFLTVGELLRLARQSPSTVHQLRLAESPIATGDQGYLCLVGLRDYSEFVSDDDGSLKERIFEGNVRDYQGNTEVNQAIRASLSQPGPEDFWWLNNGISVICTSASLSGKTLTIENPEVVNGLQTSREIHHVLSAGGSEDDKRTVLVRVLVPQEEESRDQIIRATNSQTSIPIASLRATDTIHRNIEDFLFNRSLFYDRRKNYYKNQGRPVKSILSISSLAQFILACAFRDPGNARVRPSSLIKRDEDYRRIFNEDYPLRLYYVCAILGRKVNAALRSEDCAVERSEWNNIRYYAAMLLSLRLAHEPLPSLEKIAELDINAADESFVLDCISEAWQCYEVLGGTDQVAKGNEFGQRLLDQHKKSFGASTSTDSP